MSSMRHAVQRRNYRERAQPREREKWGLLEKHKDYTLRAQDYNEKKKRLQQLRRKAAERNPDEFHFAMLSSRTRSEAAGGTRIMDRGNRPLSQDVVQLMKTQDVGYVRTALQQARRARQKLEQDLLLQEAFTDQTQGMLGKPNPHTTSATSSSLQRKASKSKGSSPNHVVFVASTAEQKTWQRPRDVKAAQSTIDLRNDIDWAAINSPELQRIVDDIGDEDAGSDSEDQDSQSAHTSRSAALPRPEAQREARNQRKKRQKQLEAKQNLLTALRRREEELQTAEQELGLQRGRMSNTVGSTTKAGSKFKIRKRKR